MYATKVTVAVLMIVAAAMVPLVPSVKSGMEFYALMGIGVGQISFLRWFWWRISAWTELAVLVTSASLAAVNLVLVNVAPELVLFGFEFAEMPFVVKFVIILPLTLGVAMLVTLVTKPTKRAKLNEFYRIVRPGGFWSIVDDAVRRLPGKAVNSWTVLHCLSGLALSFGISLGIGFAILQQWLSLTLCLGTAGIGAFGVGHFLRVVQREFEHRRSSDSQKDENGETIVA